MKLNSFVKGILVTVGLYAALIVLFGAVTLFGMVEVNINGILFEESSSNILPSSIQYMYIFFIFVGVVLYYTSSAEKIEETIRPMANFVFNPEKKASIKVGQYTMYSVLPFLFAFVGYNQMTPKFPEPIALRVIHPAPPTTIKIFGEAHNLISLENPYRQYEKSDPEEFKQLAREGGFIYFQNCFFCHGDFLDGRGMTSLNLNPVPANFQDVGTIAMLQEAFLFWRIGTGGPGLPDESWPWQSAMPIWQNILTQQEVWKVILFLYDYTPPQITPRTFS
jgi:mono/diheme cytochrome c family protein